VNNAGKHLTKYNQPFIMLPRSELRALLEVNVIGVVNCTVSALDLLKVRGGVVVNIASVASNLLVSPYGISKLAVRGLTVALATELAPFSIRVNAISPGVIDTPAVLEDFTDNMMQSVIDRQLIKRPGHVEDLVGAVLYLCSDAASFVTGETLRVSGGWPLIN